MSINNLSTLIDTTKLVSFLKETPDSKPETNELFIDSSKIEEYIDKQIPKKQKEKYSNIIDLLLNYYVEYEEFEYKDIDGKFYKNDECNIIFGYLKYKTNESENEHIYVLSHNDENNKSFMMLGNFGSHPCIMTDTFVYDNSDGSGPSVFNIQNEDKVSCDLIIHKIYTYFTEFCNDSFH